MKRILFLLLALSAFAPDRIYTLRVVSLAPNVTEMIFFLGAGSGIAAVSRQCDHPEAAEKLPKIGDMGNVDVEKIVSLRPDLVIASSSGNSREQVERIRSLGIRVETLSELGAIDILSNLVVIGNLLGKSPDAAVRECRKYLDAVTPPDSSGPKTLVLISVFPFFSASTNSFIGDVIFRAGLDNAVRTAVRYPQIGREEILHLKPEIVLVSDRFRGEEAALKDFFSRLKLKTRILFFPEDTLSRPGPRIFGAILELSRLRKTDRVRRE